MIIIRLNKLRCLAAILGAIAFVGLNPFTAYAGTSIVSKTHPAQQRFVAAKASAYSSGAADNAQWVGRTAIGTSLRSGAINSAASDWSKFPLGTKFRVVETGKIYQVDDYGSAMVGKMKVDLFTPSTKAMDKWGVRNVTLEILEWGDRQKSLALLLGRSSQRYSHIRKMIASLRAEA
jgi:3D (Asp-Asp-Asp) domain-containing protein